MGLERAASPRMGRGIGYKRQKPSTMENCYEVENHARQYEIIIWCNSNS